MPERPRSALTILRRRQVESESGYPRSTLYYRIAQRLWPKPINIGARAVGWPASEVDAMNADRISGKSDDAIREIVKALERARATADALL